LSKGLVVYGSAVGSCFNIQNCAYFMIGLILFYQVIVMLRMDFWPKFACKLETSEWKTKRWHL